MSEYRWKWMKPDKTGVWAFGGYDESTPDTKSGVSTFVIQGKRTPRWDDMAWHCFLMDIPQIQIPPKKMVTKRLWLRKKGIMSFEPGVQLIKNFEEAFGYEERWEPNDIVPEGWISTNVTKEVEE